MHPTAQVRNGLRQERSLELACSDCWIALRGGISGRIRSKRQLTFFFLALDTDPMTCLDDRVPQACNSGKAHTCHLQDKSISNR